MSRRQVSAVLGLSESAVHHRIREGVYVEDGGRLDLVATADAERRYKRSEERGTSAATERVKIAQARRLEIANDQRLGELLAADEVDALLSTCMATVARMCDALGPRLAAIITEGLTPAAARLRADEETRAIREAAYLELAREAAADAGRDDDPPDTEDDAGPVGRRASAGRGRKRGGRKVPQ